MPPLQQRRWLYIYIYQRIHFRSGLGRSGPSGVRTFRPSLLPGPRTDDLPGQLGRPYPPTDDLQGHLGRLDPPTDDLPGPLGRFSDKIFRYRFSDSNLLQIFRYRFSDTDLPIQYFPMQYFPIQIFRYIFSDTDFQIKTFRYFPIQIFRYNATVY